MVQIRVFIPMFFNAYSCNLQALLGPLPHFEKEIYTFIFPVTELESLLTMILSLFLICVSLFVLKL
jgi:hypothetical protein